MGVLRVLGRQGDLETRWEKGDTYSEGKAVEVFNKALASGGLAFVQVGGGIPDRITAFRPDADEIIITRQISGG